MFLSTQIKFLGRKIQILPGELMILPRTAEQEEENEDPILV